MAEAASQDPPGGDAGHAPVLLAETLRMHRSSELADHGWRSGAYLHVLAETFRGAVAWQPSPDASPAWNPDCEEVERLLGSNDSVSDART